MTKRERQFLDYLKNQKGLSTNTLKSYEHDIFLLEEFLNINQIGYEEVNADIIESFLSIQIQKNVSHRSIQRRLCAYRAFFQYLLKKGDIKSNPFVGISSPKYAKKLPDVLYQDEIRKVLDMNKKRTDYLKERDQAILELLFGSGLRASELLSLTRTSFNYRNRTMNILGKGNKWRIVPFSIDAEEAVKKYIDGLRGELLEKNHNAIRVNALFLNSRGEPLTVRGLEYIIKNLDHKLSASLNMHPHELRHSFATNLVNNGASLSFVQELLGHKSINTTQIYTHTSTQMMQDEYNAFFPKRKK